MQRKGFQGSTIFRNPVTGTKWGPAGTRLSVSELGNTKPDSDQEDGAPQSSCLPIDLLDRDKRLGATWRSRWIER